MDEKRNHVRGSGFRNWYIPLSALTPQEQERYFRMTKNRSHRCRTSYLVEIRQQIIDERPNPNPTTPGGVRKRL
jgi:hypothetical protein